jgi:transcriptional regulator with XRE-family HTH domain
VRNAEDDPRKQFGDAVRRYRIAAGLSQERLAQLAGIHRNYAGAVERGERNIAILNMARIAAALGIKLRDLVGEVEPRPSANLQKRRRTGRTDG